MIPAFALALLLRSAASAATLRDCYQWAQFRSEMLKIRQEEVVRSQSLSRAALGRALPRLEFDWMYTLQDPNGVDQLEAQGFGPFVQKNQVDARFTVTQPIFSGLREWSALLGLRRETERDRLLVRTAAGQLYESTADSFYSVLGGEAERNDTEAALKLAQDRVRELSGFRKLGKARESEVFAAKSKAASIQGALARIEARIRAAREDLASLTGVDLSTAALEDELASPPPSGALDQALSRASDRSDIRAQREALAATEWRVRYEKGAYWPSIDAAGDYYTNRVSYLDPISWDVRLNAAFPIYQGGSVAANIKAAEAASRQAELSLEELRREVLSLVRNAHSDLLAAVEDFRALEEAASAAKSSYDSLMKEYSLGLVTNLEVLTALDSLQEQNRERDAARFDAKRLYIRLNVATESLP